MASPSVRTITADEVAPYLDVTRTAMHGPPVLEEVIEDKRKLWDFDRCHAAVDSAGELCGSALAFGTELTVPGGTVRAAGVTGVGVLPTHRRQGHLRRMMGAQLADIVERGEAVAVLIAAEYPIYGRYGYGPAIEACGVQIDPAAEDRWLGSATGSVELVDNKRFQTEVAELYDRARLGIPGHMTHEPDRWEVEAGLRTSWSASDAEKRRDAPKVLWRDDVGQVQGGCVYSVDSRWTDNRPDGQLSADLFIVASDEAQRELVRYLTSVDWMQRVRLNLRPIDDPTPLWLRDGRDATLIDRSDMVWARVLDVPAALSARRYASEGRLVFEVDDPMGFAGGVFSVEGGPNGAVCEASTDSPDLVVPVTALSSAYLGGESWARLAGAGWVDERHPGALATASAMFTSARAPHTPLGF